MKEYTYVNKKYLGIIEGKVEPSTQYLWLNDGVLKRFNNGRWEELKELEVYTTDFVFGHLIRNSATASRELLNAVKSGKIIRIPNNAPGTSNTGYIIVDASATSSGSVDTLNIFCTQNSTGFPTSIFTQAVFRADTTAAPLTIIYNQGITTNPDWSINYENSPNYIANRTHYHSQYGAFAPGQRYAITDTETTHDLNNYRLLIKGDLFKIQEGIFSIEKEGAYIKFNCLRSESGGTVTWTFSTIISRGFEENARIIVASKLGSNYKPLDEFYLPDEAKPWKTIIATPQAAEPKIYVFRDMNSASISSGDNVLRNKVIYNVAGATYINIDVPSSLLLEFKINVNGGAIPQFSTNYKIVWENGVIPDTGGSETIYSFLVMGGKIYASAKVYK